MLGGILVKIAFFACFGSVVSFFENHRTGNAQALRIGRILFHSSVVLVLFISALQLYNIITHQFQYTYIWSYSSRELSLPLLISTFYAGQEGSFMLWTLYTALIGVFLMRDSAQKGYEPQVMTVFGSILLMLLLMLVLKNPFLFVWESWKGQVEAGFVPTNGRGLNPLLQNYWMVIHPQVLFSGFAAMGVPYAYAIAALMKRDYKNWIKPATPWIVYGAAVLGCGIMMGGFWAYETLGWGGYWGWDPVENSSLVPWLFSVGTIHTILSQRKSGAFVRTNLVMAMMCFLMVLYSTFLTRSGVLGDTSVHSFVDPGMLVYWFLVAVIVLFAGAGALMLFIRRKEMPKVPPKHSYFSREFALLLGATALVFAALFITVGTSSPLISQIFQGKTTAVDTSYYVTTIVPLGIAIGLLSGIGQLLFWNRTEKKGLLKIIGVPAVIALFATLAMIAFMNLRDVIVMLFVFGAAFSLAANSIVGWRIIKGNPKYAGGSIAHVGLAIMFLGFVGSAKYDNKETLSLAQGEPVECLNGYKLTYTGYKPIDQEKYAFHVKVEKDGNQYIVSPIMFYSKYNDGLMRNPDIVNLVTKDFYVAPLSLEQAGNEEDAIEKVTFKKGETKKVGEFEVTFVDFDFPINQKAAMLEGREVKIGATLRVKGYGVKPFDITPAKVMNQGQAADKPATVADKYQFTIISMKPDRENKENSTVDIGYKNLALVASKNKSKADVLVVEASVKPYINLVWSGVIIVLVGFMVTIVRRAQVARRREIVIPKEVVLKVERDEVLV